MRCNGRTKKEKGVKRKTLTGKKGGGGMKESNRRGGTRERRLKLLCPKGFRILVLVSRPTKCGVLKSFAHIR